MGAWDRALLVEPRTPTTLWLLLASVLTAVLTVPFGAVSYVFVTGLTLTHDARGMPVESRAAGLIALYGAQILVSALVSYAVARSVPRVRAKHMASSGLLAGLLLWSAWVFPQLARGVALDQLAWASGLVLVTTLTAATMGAFGWLGARSREP